MNKISSCTKCNVGFLAKNGSSGKFCSQSCAAKYNNTIRSKESREKQRNTIRTHSDKSEYKPYYKSLCNFRISESEFYKIKGYELFIELGIYDYKNNRSGVVKDHILSKEYGWKNKINPKIIAHPANCQFMLQNENSRKNDRSDITLDQLIDRIKIWDQINILEDIYIEINYDKPVLYEGRIPKYRYNIVNIITNEKIEVFNLTKWAKSLSITITNLYRNYGNWRIIEKYDIKTGDKII